MDNFVRLAILGNKSIKQGYHKHSQVAYKILFGKIIGKKDNKDAIIIIKNIY